MQRPWTPIDDTTRFEVGVANRAGGRAAIRTFLVMLLFYVLAYALKPALGWWPAFGCAAATLIAVRLLMALRSGSARRRAVGHPTRGH